MLGHKQDSHRWPNVASDTFPCSAATTEALSDQLRARRQVAVDSLEHVSSALERLIASWPSKTRQRLLEAALVTGARPEVLRRVR